MFVLLEKRDDGLLTNILFLKVTKINLILNSKSNKQFFLINHLQTRLSKTILNI